jgi:hypothetical protein
MEMMRNNRKTCIKRPPALCDYISLEGHIIPIWLYLQFQSGNLSTLQGTETNM